MDKPEFGFYLKISPDSFQFIADSDQGSDAAIEEVWAKTLYEEKFCDSV